MPAPRKIALTGASSFTGYWISNELSRQGWEVAALCSGPESSYTGLRLKRLQAVAQKNVSLHYEIDGSSQSMTQWIDQNRPEIWIHHHFFMKDFRSPHYDVERAEVENIAPLDSLVRALARSGCQGVIYSGSYFEPGEGGPGAAASDPTPYAKMKNRCWHRLRELCEENRIAVSKVVIPNPIGPSENEDRLIPMLLQKSKNAEPLRLTSPKSVADNLPVRSLAACYARVADDLSRGAPQIARPSGWICDTQHLVGTVSKELIEKRLGMPSVLLELQNAEPKTFRNSEPCSYDLNQLWDDYANWLKNSRMD
jgi:nucleoside-diphosphate-sugar epimerase